MFSRLTLARFSVRGVPLRPLTMLETRNGNDDQVVTTDSIVAPGGRVPGPTDHDVPTGHDASVITNSTPLQPSSLSSIYTTKAALFQMGLWQQALTVSKLLTVLGGAPASQVATVIAVASNTREMGFPQYLGRRQAV